ncbi:hypothetical protein ACFYZ2_14885 [Streptomyces sviceus]|uniref:hypothetical protein n=1 Tax=Streptomyces sviceus TaxID=285530 RepID=UPI0036A60A67
MTTMVNGPRPFRDRLIAQPRPSGLALAPGDSAPAFAADGILLFLADREGSEIVIAHRTGPAPATADGGTDRRS